MVVMLRDKVKQLIEERDAYKNKYQNLENILMKHGINTENIQQIEEDLTILKNGRKEELVKLEGMTKDRDLKRDKNNNLTFQHSKEIEKLNNENNFIKGNQKSLYMFPPNNIDILYGDQNYSIFNLNVGKIVTDENNNNYNVGSQRMALEMALASIKVRRGLMSSNTTLKINNNSLGKEEDVRVREKNEMYVQKIALDISVAKIEEMRNQMVGLCKYNERLRKRVCALQKNALYSWKEYD